MVNVTNKDILYVLGLSAIFVAGFLGASLLYAFWLTPIKRRRNLRRRLQDNPREKLLRNQVFKNDEEDDNKKSLILVLCYKFGWHRRLAALERSLRQADIYWNVGLFLAVVGLVATISFILAAMWGSFTGALVLALAMGAMPFFVVRVKKNYKTNLVESQMPDIMELLSRSLRAGHTLASAIELASQETPHPLGTELRIAYEEQRLGISMAQALRHMAERVASPDLRYFVTAVLIQTETGGNLAEIMEKIGYLIRDRLRVKGKIRGLTAEGRLSAIVLGVLPFAMFLLLYVVQRGYVMILLNDDLGRKMLVVGIISITLGIITMKKMIKIKV